jgi:hypothetical protein
MSIHRFEIVPHAGIGPIRLGISPAEADAVLGPLQGALPMLKKSQHVRCYFQASFEIEFGGNGTARFIGISHHPSLLCLYHGHDVFDLAAPELFAQVASRELSNSHKYSASEYLFPDQIVTLYGADPQYDFKGNESRPVYGQVGIGTADYLKEICSIRAATR